MESDTTVGRRPIIDRYFAFMRSLRSSDRVILVACIVLFFTSGLYTAYLFNEDQKSTVATTGGTFTEGIVGTPRFVNPVLAITRADQDIAALVYSGLLRLAPDGSLENDLADSITISDDGLVYNIILKDSNYFHDGTRLTAEDVAYTIALMQDPLLKSPLRGNWNDVMVEVISDSELNLVLAEPYTPFIENLTVGILPKHIWSDLSVDQLPFSQNNTEPIGSGPYQLERVSYNRSGLIDAYTLVAAERDNQANITTILLKFYPNEETLKTAFLDGEFAATAGLPEADLDEVNTDTHQIITAPLPRQFSVFLNQNKSAALREPEVRAALSAAINREALVESVLATYGVPSFSPIPTGFIEVESANGSTSQNATTTGDLQYAASLLVDAGWERGDGGTWKKEIDEVETTLGITIATANTEVFETTAEQIRSAWEALGVEVSIALFEQTDLVQVIIRPRDFEALLFGTDLGRQIDLYPFWHSSQKDDPGLNIAAYANITTDDFLETARETQDERERTAALNAFATEVVSETPAIFLYSPLFTYVVRNDVSLSPINRLIRPNERFSNSHTWYMSENDVWPIFAQ